jgi:hypothetical protein
MPIYGRKGQDPEFISSEDDTLPLCVYINGRRTITWWADFNARVAADRMGWRLVDIEHFRHVLEATLVAFEDWTPE